MSPIGFTTGCLYKTDISFGDRIKLYSSLGAEAIELSFSRPDELLKFKLKNETKKIIGKFRTVTIHAPWINVNYDDDTKTREILKSLRSLSNDVNPLGVVFHPDIIKDFNVLEISRMPIVIENMDKRKNYGNKLEHIKEIKDKFSFNFILDIQHSYENDPTNSLCRELIKLMGKKLKYIHISGYSDDNNHALGFESKNKIEIEKILKLKLNVPKIMEGIMTQDINNKILKELKFIRGYET